MDLPGFFKPVKEKDLETTTSLQRVANPFSRISYEVVVDKKGRVTGDSLDYYARKMTSK